MNVETIIWVQRDKTQIRLGDMTHSHLANAIKMIDRQIEKHAAEIDACYAFSGGDHAMDLAEQSANAASNKLNIAMAWKEMLTREQKRRASLSTGDDAISIMQEALS